MGPLIETRMVVFWHKTITGLNTKLSYRLLYLQNKRREQNPEAAPWLKKIEEILNSCNMRNVWLNPKSYQPLQIKTEITKQLTNTYIQAWKGEVAIKSSYITYRSFKSESKLEKYLMMPE